MSGLGKILQEKVLRDMIDTLNVENVQLRQENIELRQQLADVGQWTGRHVIDLREDGFTIMHPLSCRPNLFDCIYNYDARRIDPDEHELGRFYCEMTSVGLFIQEPA